MKILVVDDDPELRPLVAFALRQGGYLVLEAATGEAALETAAGELPDLVVLDVNLPGIDGFEVCRRLRQSSRAPILMLTVRGEEGDTVRGLDLGADDYLTKPFSPRTLLARVRAALRRAQQETAPQPLAVGRLCLDPERHTVQVGAAPPVALTRLELRLLQLLLAQAGHTVPPERLLRHLWGSSPTADREHLKQLVYRLRQKIELDSSAPRHLLTDPGAGYRLDAEG
jgi:DNA-binding response OmpR family regulator